MRTLSLSSSLCLLPSSSLSLSSFSSLSLRVTLAVEERRTSLEARVSPLFLDEALSLDTRRESLALEEEEASWCGGRSPPVSGRRSRAEDLRLEAREDDATVKGAWKRNAMAVRFLTSRISEKAQGRAITSSVSF